MDLSNYTLAQLRELSVQVEKQIASKQKLERENALNEIYRIAHNLNMPLDKLLNVKQVKTAPTVLYQDPANPNNKWVGRGPRPTWLKQAIAGGANMDDFRVQA